MAQTHIKQNLTQRQHENELVQSNSTLNYNEEQIAEFKEAFSLFDRQGDGTINLSELGTVVRSLGFNPTESTIKQFQQDYNSNGINKINFHTFLQLLNNCASEIDDPTEVIEAFRVFDKEGNGYISKEELTHIMTHLGEKLNNDEVNEMIRDADIYCDGKIRYEVFVKMITKLR
ncbi:unnamed protein product [Didymodactylos carnosus]|uniref:EF-hand domain-containing protein n=1 Tax=Didymodactylos carnosus TaxID=1234261 RepID=A0A813RQJ5_9BILA|nr:unnamed protein product [Didymodactylos carnosus]CAF3568193.1 unnamed protein product [Didymodactylos carnosus]